MAIRSSAFFNDPAMAQAASNLAQIFAPPSGADAAGWATANAKNAEAKRLADLYNEARTAEGFDQTRFDRQNIAVGNYAPSQSYHAVDLGDATTAGGRTSQQPPQSQTIGQIISALSSTTPMAR